MKKKKNVIFYQCMWLVILIFLMVISLIFVYNVKTTLPKLFGLSFFVIFFLIACNSIRVIRVEKGKEGLIDINYNYFAFLIVLIIMFVGCSYSFVTNVRIRTSGDKVVATVYDVAEKVRYRTINGTSKRIVECNTFVEYSVNGSSYKQKLSVDSCDYKKGDEVEVYYDRNNPGKIVSISFLWPLTGCVISFVALLIVALSPITSKKKKSISYII